MKTIIKLNCITDNLTFPVYFDSMELVESFMKFMSRNLNKKGLKATKFEYEEIDVVWGHIETLASGMRAYINKQKG